MSFNENIILRLNNLIKENDKKILVFPESKDVRILKAAEKVNDMRITKGIFLLGQPDEINETAKNENISLDNIEIIDPENSGYLKEFADEYYALRKHKGISEIEAGVIVKKDLYFGAMMVRKGYADGMIAGSIASTADVMRSSIQIIKTVPKVKTVSSCFVMAVPNCEYGDNGNIVFADCAVNPFPNSEQLADIAISSANTYKNMFKKEPIVAMLSFSTKGSAKHENIDKVIEAVKIAKEKQPDLQIDGELQADAALLPSIGSKKAPDSDVAGKANVIIFPDLNAGNIGYKLVQRLAKAEAYGPIIQGLNKPVNDLSRGCSVEDIVNLSVITLISAY